MSSLPSLKDFLPLLRILGRIIGFITILTRIRHLVLEHLDELVEEDCDERADEWSNPCFKLALTRKPHEGRMKGVVEIVEEGGGKRTYNKSSAPDQK